MLTASHNGEVCKAVSLGPLIKKFCINVPEHDLLFLATQAAYAAGLPQAKDNVTKYIKRQSPLAFKLGALVGEDKKVALNIPQRADTRNWTSLWLMPEQSLYTMLLRGNSPLTEPFRKWVTEEVLPTIRKTGSYNAEAIVI